jgi:hypothetical protein
MQKLAGIITESEYKQDLEETNVELDDQEQDVIDGLKSEMDGVLKGMEKELEKVSKTANEAILTTASIALALPAIIGLISRLGKSAGTLVNKMLGKKPSNDSDYQKWMAKLGDIADQLHHLYVIPIEAIVKKFVKDPKKAHKVANGIFHVIVAVLFIASGVTAVKALQAKNVSLATLESALSAVKGGEIQTYISDLFISALANKDLYSGLS